MNNVLQTAVIAAAAALAGAQNSIAADASLPASASTWIDVPTQAVSAGGVEYAYRELGRDNAGPPVILLTHLAAVLDNWDPRVVDGLAAKRHVIAFDNRGVGASSGSAADSIEQMADDATTFIKALGYPQVDLFGFSMGGMVAQEVVLKQPQLVRRMILAGTGPAGGEGISNVVGITNLDILHALFTREDPKLYMFFTRTPEGEAAGQAFIERLQERRSNRDKEIRLLAFSAQMRALSRWGQKAPVDLSQVTQPVLVVNGDSDRMVPSSNSRDLARRLPNSTLVLYSNSGHGGVFQHYAEFVPLAVDFLAR